MRDRIIEFRVFDLHNEVVLYNEDIPDIVTPPYNLIEAIRRFSGQTYQLSQFIERIDKNGRKIYQGDFIKIFKFIPSDNFESTLIEEGIGIVEYQNGDPSIFYFKNNEPHNLYFSNHSFDFEVVGNYLENKDLRKYLRL